MKQLGWTWRLFRPIVDFTTRRFFLLKLERKLRSRLITYRAGTRCAGYVMMRRITHRPRRRRVGRAALFDVRLMRRSGSCQSSLVSTGSSGWVARPQTVPQSTRVCLRFTGRSESSPPCYTSNGSLPGLERRQRREYDRLCGGLWHDYGRWGRPRALLGDPCRTSAARFVSAMRISAIRGYAALSLSSGVMRIHLACFCQYDLFSPLRGRPASR
jgi:hypothetical protein